jgi:hypothetical protein
LILAGTRNQRMFDEAVATLRIIANDQLAVARYLDENGLR